MNIASEYARLRRKGWAAESAWRAAKANVAFADKEADGLVKLEAEPDCGYYWDVWGKNPANLPPRQWEKEEKEINAQLERYGYWILVGYARASEDDSWTVVDSCGGFFGNDLRDNMYDTDIKRACLDWLDAEDQIKADELAGRATYAAGEAR